MAVVRPWSCTGLIIVSHSGRRYLLMISFGPVLVWFVTTMGIRLFADAPMVTRTVSLLFWGRAIPAVLSSVWARPL